MTRLTKEFFREQGALGGKQSALNMSPEERSARARKAALARFKPKRSAKLEATGHAGGHLRDAFTDAFEGFTDEWWKHVDVSFYGEGEQLWWDELSDWERSRWLVGQLWNCRDILPGMIRQQFRDDYNAKVGTYGAAMRVLKQELDEVPAEDRSKQFRDEEETQ